MKPRRLLLSIWIVATAIGSTRAHANPRVEVRGASHFATEARPSRGDIVVSGSLLDDLGHTVGLASITVRMLSAAGEVLAPGACDKKTGLTAEADGVWRLETRPDGSFCVHARPAAGVPGATTSIRLAWLGGPLLDGTSAELSVDPSRWAVTLAFDPEPRVVALGDSPIKVAVVAKVATDDTEGAHANRALTLTLADEHDKPLGNATTDDLGQALFVLDPHQFGVAGPGELRASFAGNEADAPARLVVASERRARVAIAARGQKLVAGAPPLEGSQEEDGVGIDLDVVTALGALVPSGSVEGLIDNVVVGAAPVTRGQAHLVMQWTERAERLVVVRYVPDVSWYLAGAPLIRSIVAHPAVRWRGWGVAVAGFGMVIAFFVARSRGVLRPQKRSVTSDVLVSTAFPRLDVIAPDTEGKRTWEGRVVDAHDGEPVGGASIVLERPGFVGVAAKARCVADDAGVFALTAPDIAPGDRLSVEGRLHTRLTRGIPGFGVLEVALVSRRRAVLSRLIRWARSRGAPYDMAPEPTPEHIRRMGGGNPETVVWAEAVERTAFGPGDVDARVEAEVNNLGHEKTDSR